MTTIYRAGNSFADSPAGTDDAEVAEAIRAITVGNRRRKRGQRLDPSPQVSAIEAERTTAPRVTSSAGTGGSGGGGMGETFTEQPYTGTAFVLYTSSDGLFTMNLPAAVQFLDENLNGRTFNRRAP